jgi:hypothetical protein
MAQDQPQTHTLLQDTTWIDYAQLVQKDVARETTQAVLAPLNSPSKK